jgi:hypothetical protein
MLCNVRVDSRQHHSIDSFKGSGQLFIDLCRALLLHYLTDEVIERTWQTSNPRLPAKQPLGPPRTTRLLVAA